MVELPPEDWALSLHIPYRLLDSDLVDYILDEDALRERVARFICLAVEAEREACAKLADDLAPSDPTDSRYAGAAEASKRIAVAIRARGADHA